MAPLWLVPNVDDEGVELIILVVQVLAGENFAEIDCELEVEGLFYLLASAWIFEETDCDDQELS